MDDISRVSIEQNILTMPIPETTSDINDDGQLDAQNTYPRINPTIDITAAVLP